MRRDCYVPGLERWNRHSSCSVCLKVRLKRSNRIYSDREWGRRLSCSFGVTFLGGFLWMWQWNFGLLKNRCISRSTEQLSVHCERLFSVGLEKKLFQIKLELTPRHSATWKGNRSLTSQEIPYVFVCSFLPSRTRVVSILIQKNPVYIFPCYLRLVLLLCSYLLLDLPNVDFPRHFRLKVLYIYVFLLCVAHAPPKSSSCFWTPR